jgi:predicted ATPase
LFKHALVQDAAYGTLLREPRRALHARIADALERRFTDHDQHARKRRGGGSADAVARRPGSSSK